MSVQAATAAVQERFFNHYDRLAEQLGEDLAVRHTGQRFGIQPDHVRVMVQERPR